MQILTANDIYKSFDGVEVLKGISVGVNKGEVLAIIGPSGSGKSTFLRCVTQLETVDAGDITICGEKLVQNGADGKAQYADKAACGKIGLRIGLVFQNFNLFPHFSVLRNITEAPIRVLGKSREEAEKAARQLLVKMNLADKADAYPFQLSGGQQQRVSIARALVGNPSLILADEPTGALDSKTSREVLDFLKQLHDEGNTVVIITHDNSIAMEAERVVKIHDGKIIFDGDVSAYESIL